MDLEISVETVSRLVLGHLRSEKNKNAYKEYLNSCQHFRNVSSPTNKRKFINTRLHGLSLLEILLEYAAVYNLVQEYLDGVGYFRSHRKTCLLDELEYLLSLTGAKFDQNRSRSSTPLRTHCSSPLMQSTNHLSPIIESEVNATALQDLPGNAAESRPKDKSNELSLNTSKASPPKDNDADSNGNGKKSVNDEEMDSNGKESPDKSTNSAIIDCSLERIQQTILENPEFQAKIAENINSIINASFQSVNKENTDKTSSKVAPELDSTIKLILQKTEEDPLFERLLEDLIGDATSVSSQENQRAECSDQMLHTPKKLLTINGNGANIKQRLRSSRKSDMISIDSTNIDIIDKIVAVAAIGGTSDNNMTGVNVNTASVNVNSYHDNNTLVVPVTTTCQNMTATTNTLSNAEIILYDGPIDTLFQQNVTTAQNSATPGLLMLQSHGQGQAIIDTNQRLTQVVQTASLDGSNSAMVNAVPCDVAKPYYMISDNGDMISLPPQMIICTSDAGTLQQSQYIGTASMAQQQNVATTTTIVLPSMDSRYVNITAPSDKPSNTLVDLFSSYKGNESSTTCATKTKRRPAKSKDRQPVKRIKTILPMPTYKIEILPIPDEPIPVLPTVMVPIILDNAGVKENIPLNSSDCPETPAKTPDMPIAKKSTPKSGSHVRMLDFNFVTPSKELTEKTVKKDGKNGKSVKSLFAATPSQVKAQKSWDANLRELAIPSETPPWKKPPDIDIKPTLEPAEVPKVEDVQPKPVEIIEDELNCTANEANCIEAALLLDSSARKPTPIKKTNQPMKKSLRLRQKPVENSPNAVEAADTLLALSQPPPQQDETVTIQEPPPSPIEPPQCCSTPIVPESCSMRFDAIPMATPPSTTKSRFKKKCNIDSSIKQEVTVTRVKEIKSLDILTENGSKLILSPSKLANKRSIVTETESAANRLNMNMPMLETPVKLNILGNVPQTPNVSNMEVGTNDTPFTKMFNEQMEGVDISAISTPKLPITPSLNMISPFTSHQTGCFNRPTDYSTSSSYYQPSDSEQNKSLEKQIIEECKRLENGKNMSNNLDTQSDILELKEVETLEAIATVMKTMKTNIGIGRKDLNLLSKASSSSSDSSSTATSSSDSDSDESICQRTVIASKESTVYKHRSRTTSPVHEFQENVKDINAILSSTNFKSELKVILPDITITQQEKVLHDMEAKRKRTIARFKGSAKKDAPVVQKGVTTRSSRGRLIKPVCSADGDDRSRANKDVKLAGVKERGSRAKPKVQTQNKKTAVAAAKRKSPVKSKKSMSGKLKPGIITKLDPLDIVEAHLSEHSAASTPVREEPPIKKQTQEESQSILNQILTLAKTDQGVVCKTAKIPNKQECKVRDKTSAVVKVPESKVSPDLEAEKLVKGLKQWGIHLVPKARIAEVEETPYLNPLTVDKPHITFDDRQYTERDAIQITYNPNMAVTKTLLSYDLNVLTRKFTSRIFIEELNQDVDIPLSVSAFECLFDLPADITTGRIHILNEVIVSPTLNIFNSCKSERRKLLDILSKSPEGGRENVFASKSAAVNTNCTDFLTSRDEMPKSITDFRMIKDMQAKLESAHASTPKPCKDDDSLYDFVLTDVVGKTAPSPKLSKKRALNDPTEDLSLKRPKIDHEKILQEIHKSEKKKSSKCVLSTSNTVKSKSDHQLLEKIDVEHFLSVLHP